MKGKATSKAGDTPTPLDQVFKGFKKQPLSKDAVSKDVDLYKSEIVRAKVKLELKGKFRDVMAQHNVGLNIISEVADEIEHDWMGGA